MKGIYFSVVLISYLFVVISPAVKMLCWIIRRFGIVLILFIYTNCWSLSIYVSMLCLYKFIYLNLWNLKLLKKELYFLKSTEIRSDFRFWFTYDKKNHVSWHVRCSWFCQHFVIFHEHAMNKIIVKVCLLITWPNTKR